MNQNIFHLIFVVTFLTFTVIRMYYHTKARRREGKVTFKEGNLHRSLRKLFGVPYILILFAYMVKPSILSWAAVPLPDWAGWLGAALSLVSLPLILWVQWALDINFSTTLHVRDAHTLVSHGPYRWVRHPMYSIFFFQSVGFLLLTANVFIGGIYLAALTLIVLTRIRNEENTMIEKFGDEYRQYMVRTGRFFPRLR